MTRYARMKRDQKIQESNSTPWSVLVKQGCKVESKESKFKKLRKQKLKKKKVKQLSSEGVEMGEGDSPMVGKDNAGFLDDDNIPAAEMETAPNMEEAFEERDLVEEKGEFSDRIRETPLLKKVKPTGANSTMSFQGLSELTESLLALANVEEVKQKVRQLWREGQLDHSQAAKLVRKWRSHQWHTKHNEAKEKLVKDISRTLDCTEEQTLDDVRHMVNKYVTAGKILYEDAALIIKKWKKREGRRIKRHIVKENKSCCFYCRQTGHKFSECPEKDGEIMGTGICFKCGSTEHTSSRCLRKNVRGFPYATCFVCKQQGHLSRDCDQNANGIYPDGGSCNLCGSQKHLKKDCPLKKSDDSSSKNEIVIGGRAANTGGDDDVSFDERGVVNNTTKRKQFERKIVRI